MAWYVLDTSLLLGGKEPPAVSEAHWATTPEADAEISPGGRDARRYAFWKEQGLQVRAASPASMDRVQKAGQANGALGRLSVADRSLVALSLDLQATLVSDDMTVLDLANGLGVAVQTINQRAPTESYAWAPRCTGCGRWFEAGSGAEQRECGICGSPVVLRRQRPGSSPASGS